MDQMRRLITTWDNIHEIIDKAMEKHDRWDNDQLNARRYAIR